MVEKLSASEPDRATMDSQVFRAIADYTYDWESWHAPGGKLLWVNAAVERMTGFSPAECLTMEAYPLPLVPEAEREKIAAVLLDARSGGSGNDLEFQLLHRDGPSRWAAVSWQPMFDEQKRHLGFRTSVRDITERHELREQLRLYNQHLEQLVQERTAKVTQLEEHRLKIEKLAALGQLAAGVAHEVNNPLAGIRNAFALFKSNLSQEDENFELLELIDAEIERISSITHQMYQLYRPDRPEPATFDLQKTVSSVATLLQPLAARSAVQLEILAGPCHGCGTLGDTQAALSEGEVKQILLNIVRNAIQASPRAGVVTIELATFPTQVRIRVTDRGHGIPEGIRDRIFDPFFSTKTESPGQGMGLGLSVSRSLAESMGGAIEVESLPGRGSCFTVTLPRRVTSHD